MLINNVNIQMLPRQQQQQQLNNFYPPLMHEHVTCLDIKQLPSQDREIAIGQMVESF